MKLYKGRTEEEQKAFNAARKERRKQLAKTPEELIPDNPEDDILEIDVENIPIQSPRSFVQRMKDKFAPKEEEEKEKKPIDKDQEKRNLKFIKQVLPLTLAGLVASNSKKIFRDPYKPCAPSKDEVADILLPLFNMLSRYVEIGGEISQNTADIITSLLACFTLGARMLVTKMEIDHVSEAQKQADIIDFQQRTGSVSRGSTNTVNGLAIHPTEQQFRDGRISNIDDTNGNGNDGTSEAEKVRQLMRKDRIGRSRLGLAPWPE